VRATVVRYRRPRKPAERLTHSLGQQRLTNANDLFLNCRAIIPPSNSMFPRILSDDTIPNSRYCPKEREGNAVGSYDSSAGHVIGTTMMWLVRVVRLGRHPILTTCLQTSTSYQIFTDIMLRILKCIQSISTPRRHDIDVGFATEGDTAEIESNPAHIRQLTICP
jgi:hypothetical protein